MKTLTEGTPLKRILYFAIPLFVGQLFQLFYSLVDTRIVGATLGDVSLAAVGATTTLSDMLISMLNGLTNGAAIVVATYFGAKDEGHMKKAIGGTIALGVGFSVFVSIFCLVMLTPILKLLNVSGEILPQAKAYIGVILAGLLASTLYNVCAAILRAVGDSFTPLIFLVLAAFLNIGLDYGFILGLHMGVEGAALATVAAQAVSALLCFLYMKKKYPQLMLSKEDMRGDKAIYQKLMKSGFAMSFMISFVTLGTLALQTSINTFGTNIIVAHTAARKATSLFMLPFSVLGQTLATYCGQNLGARKFERIRKGIRDTVLIAFLWCIGVMIAAYTISPMLIRLITATRQQEVIDTATLYLKVNTVFYFVPAIISLFRNSMQGFGDSRTPVFSSSLELIGKVLIAFFLTPVLGYMGIIIAEPIVWIVMVIPLIVNMKRNPILQSTKSKTRQISGRFLMLMLCIGIGSLSFEIGALAAENATEEQLIADYEDYRGRLRNVIKREDIEKNGFRLIENQIFPLETEQFGEVFLLPGIEKTYGRLILFLAREDGTIVYQTDRLEVNNRNRGQLWQPVRTISAVSFQDLNGDNLTDIVLIITCVNREGDYKGIPYKIGDVLFQGEEGFYRDYRISDKINRFDMNKSVESIVAFVRDGYSTEFLYTADTREDLMKNRFEIIKEQCYQRQFEKLGTLEVVPGTYTMAEFSQFMIYLINEQGSIVWSLQPMGTYDNLYSLKGLKCMDLDGDGLKDIFVLARYSFAGKNNELLIETDYSVYYQRTGGFEEDKEIKNTVKVAEGDSANTMIEKIKGYWGWSDA